MSVGCSRKPKPTNQSVPVKGSPSVLQVIIGYPDERRWMRYVKLHLACWFPRVPNQPGHDKRLRKLAGALVWVGQVLAASTDQWSDGVWVVDSTPVECGRSRETAKRSEVAGWAEYGYCASHTRYFWGLRLHLVCTLSGLVVGFALGGAKGDEREALCWILSGLERRPGQTIIADKAYYGKGFEADLESEGLVLLRKARKGEAPRPGARYFKPLRQVIESINDTFKAQLSLEAHGGRTVAGVCARIAQRVLALNAVVWFNELCGAPVLRSLTAYDH
ncbi:MAG: IS982 family transposase [Bifidobacteriaceae bacterium]|nr:IS982 family transposase [Bifidobacteriaceae bacterium]